MSKLAMNLGPPVCGFMSFSSVWHKVCNPAYKEISPWLCRENNFILGKEGIHTIPVTLRKFWVAEVCRIQAQREYFFFLQQGK